MSTTDSLGQQRSRQRGAPARRGGGTEAGAHLWAIVLAGGEGSRVADMTSSGEASVPKQYWRPPGEQAMMVRWALRRAESIVPSQRVVVVVAAHHRPFWERELADLSPANIVIQPHNRGTATGVLLALLSVVLRRDPAAEFLVLPSDHYVRDEGALKDALVDALEWTQPDDSRVLLLGMTPSVFDPGYGWMLPAPTTRDGPRAISRFVEKPSPGTAARLAKNGALLNAFILVASAGALLRLFQRTLPGTLGKLSRCVRAGMQRERLDQVYQEITAADFSRDVLERSTRWLSVVPVPECGWSDLGTPARIELYLRRKSGQQNGGACC